MKTDNQCKIELEALAGLLGLELLEARGNSGTFKVNEFQDLWVKLYGYRGKGHAQLAPASTLRRGSDQAYFSNELAYQSISFAENKEVEALSKDIKRRLLMTQLQADSLNYIQRQVEAHRKGQLWQDTMAKQLEAIGFDIRGEGDKAYYNDNDLYLSIDLRSGYLDIERFSLNKAKAIESIKALVEIHKGNKS